MFDARSMFPVRSAFKLSFVHLGLAKMKLWSSNDPPDVGLTFRLGAAFASGCARAF
jgi:hypothetical protein